MLGPFMMRKSSILTCLMLALLAGSVLGDGSGPSANAGPGSARGIPRPKDGNYTLTIAGFVKGNGDSSGSTVSGNTVNFHANVVAENGTKGTLSADGLVLNGSYFKGPGTLLGQSATFRGRLDFPDGDRERAIKGVRLVCTVKTADGQYASVIGFIPAQAAAKDDPDPNGSMDRDKPPVTSASDQH
jgi:hypothetical protein